MQPSSWPLLGTGFSLACLWRFPYLMGLHGGITVLLGFAIFIALFLPYIRREAAAGNDFLSSNHILLKVSKFIHYLSCILLAALWSVVTGWALGIFFRLMISPGHVPSDSLLWFSDILESAPQTIAGSAASLIFCFFLVENTFWQKTSLKILFFFSLILFLASLFLFDSVATFTFLMRWEPAQWTWKSFTEILGMAIVFLGIGINYYSHAKIKIGLATGIALKSILFFSALFAVCAITFANGSTLGHGALFLFQSVPQDLVHLKPWQWPVGAILFLCFILLGLLSVSALLTTLRTFWIERYGFSSYLAGIGTTLLVFLISLLPALSSNYLQNFLILDRYTLLDLFDWISIGFLLPCAAVLNCIYFGWISTEGPGTSGFRHIFTRWHFRVFLPALFLIFLLETLRKN